MIAVGRGVRLQWGDHLNHNIYKHLQGQAEKAFSFIVRSKQD